MRLLHGVLLLLMLLFMAVQFNDPDGMLWVGIYGVSAALMVIALTWPNFFAQAPGRLVRWLCVAGLAAGVVWFWPTSRGFWRQEVWWETETAREGMGIMIAFIVSLSSFLVPAKGTGTTLSSDEHSLK